MQERRNSIANALELRLSCTNPSICRDNNIIFVWKQSRTMLWRNNDVIIA